MPAAVSSWVIKRSLSDVRRIHQNILKTYRDDFSKYSRRIDPERLQEIVLAVPQFLGRKFVYSAINRDVSFSSIKEALNLLCQARVCHKVTAVAANGVPLAAERLDNYIKVILLDVGLSSAELGLSMADLDRIEDIDLINKGGISEQAVGQLLRTIFPFYQEPALYYWMSTDKHSDAEINYIIQHGLHVIPIEVKAGSRGALKSLHRFMYLKGYKTAVRINSGPPSLAKMDLKDTVTYELRSISLLAFQRTSQIAYLSRISNNRWRKWIYYSFVKGPSSDGGELDGYPLSVHAI